MHLFLYLICIYMIKYKVEEKVNENGMGLGVVSWVPQEMGSLDPASA